MQAKLREINPANTDPEQKGRGIENRQVDILEQDTTVSQIKFGTSCEEN